MSSSSKMEPPPPPIRKVGYIAQENFILHTIQVVDIVSATANLLRNGNVSIG